MNRQRIALTAKRVLNAFGLDVRLTRTVRAYEERRKAEEWRSKWAPLANQHRIATVLDLGANTGQFARMIHGVFPDAAILSFEPLADCFRELQANLKDIPSAQAFNLALGAQRGTAVIRRTAFTPCSSMLPASDLMRREIRETEQVTPVTVKVERLDDVLAPLPVKAPVMLKLDVQGFEMEVLKGAPRILAMSDTVVAEVAFQPLYEGQPLFDDLYAALRCHGFVYRGNLDQNLSKVDGRILEADALFAR